MHNCTISFTKKYGRKCTKMPLVFINQVFFVHEEGVGRVTIKGMATLTGNVLE